MKRAIVLQSADGEWEALYVDGLLIDEGHTLDGCDFLYWPKVMESQELELSDIYPHKIELTSEDDEESSKYGCFCTEITDWSGYKEYRKIASSEINQ